MVKVVYAEQFGIPDHGLEDLGKIYWNLSSAQLYEMVILRREGKVVHNGPLVTRTGHYTGRSPKDRFIVEDEVSRNTICWGKENCAVSEEKFEQLFSRMKNFLHGTDMFVQECYAGKDPNYRIPIRVITENAWHSLFARNMFCRIKTQEERENFDAQWTVFQAPSFLSSPALDDTNSEAFVLLSFKRKLIIIGGTKYAGEIKKSIFSVMNYILPNQGIMGMHCSANIGKDGDTAIFFGLSGTGKTTLSADASRSLIGDDEHGWSDDGVFNIEGGCYAKVINLSPEAEPEIHDCTRRFGTILENVIYDPVSRAINLENGMLTENTRASYPISSIPNYVPTGMGGHPKNIIMLTCDAFGVLPPVSKMTPAQAMYHFISGYTAKVAGTERGITEPVATFSTCFGSPFMPLQPKVYAELLGEKIAKHDVDCWLINTGWSGGAYGIGERISIKDTRAIVNACLDGSLAKFDTRTDEFFGLHVPIECPGVNAEILDPRSTWKDQAAYDAQAKKLAGMFNENIANFDDVSDEIRSAGPPPA